MSTPQHKSKLENLLPLTPGQEGMFFHALYTPDSEAYLNQLTVRIDGALDPDRLRRAWQSSVQRHDALRSCFRWESLDQPLQLVVRELTPDWQEVDLADASPQAVEQWLEQDRGCGLDLARPGLHRVRLLRTGSGQWLFVLTIHHLIIDGWSMGVLFQELLDFYRTPTLEPPGSVGFHSYVKWVAGQDEADTEAFWRRELEGFTGCAYLGTDRHANVPDWRNGFADGEYAAVLTAQQTAALETWARRERVTTSSTLHAAYVLLLHRFTGLRDILYGVTMSGRPAELPGVDSIVGNLVNVLPVRVLVDDALSTGDWARHVQERIAAVTAVQHSSLAQVQRWSSLPVGEPLFSSFMTVENYPFDRSLTAPDPALLLSEAKAYDRTVYPLNLTVVPGEALQLRFNYDTRRFAGTDIERIAGHLTELLGHLAGESAGSSVGALLSAAWATRTPVSAQIAPQELVDVPSQISEAARSNPDGIALRQGEKVRTFAELDTAVLRTARALRRRGIGPGSRVAVQLDHSHTLVETILAVLRAGAAFVPIDWRSDSQRVERIIETAAVDLLVVADAGQASKNTRPRVAAAVLEQEAVDLPAEQVPLPSIDSDSTAYVLFTSGSTGEPKGVVVPHRSLANYVHVAVSSYLRPDGGGAPLFSSVAFDLTVTTLFAPLAAGRPLDLLPTGQGVEGVADLLARGRSFDFIKLTPSHLRMLISAAESQPLEGSVDVLVVGGEQLSEDIVHGWRALSPRTLIVNEYGPTEATVGCCAYQLKPEAEVPSKVPIGKAMPGAELYVLDERGDPAPEGVPGELFIGGLCLADGYLGRADLTASRFVPNPFADPPARLYRTGDLVRSLPGGDLVFLGRNDDQVKIRGHRIELGEVESAIRRTAQVSDCVVARWQRAADDERLVAYVVTRGSTDWPSLVASLEEELREQLPGHMVPGHFVRIDVVPQSVNGKVARDRLPEPKLSAPPADNSGSIEPRDAAELRLAAIWKDLLGLDTVDVRTPFFDLGGHSILAVRMMAQVKKAFGRTLPLSSLLSGGTIETIAEMLRSQGEILWNSLVPIRTSGAHRVSFWVHAAGGNVLSYAVISEHLGPRFPMYGLQARGLEPGADAVGDIPAMAADYIAAIRGRQPHGPYIIGGWSFGGMLALEITRQLIDLGEEVAELIMVDTGTNDAAPRTMDPEDPVFLSGLATFISNDHVDGLSPAELTAVAPEERVGHVVELAKKAGTLPPGFEVADLYRFLSVYTACNEAYRRYTPGKLPPRTTLVRAQENPDSDRQLGWSALTTGRLRVIDAPGNHVTVMNTHNVAAFAPELAQVLTEASSWAPETGHQPSPLRPQPSSAP
ncbi:amino acid adenylation domain-containing protein [Streptomyces sp. NPDC059906]|uniref:amino acid adenylation domain-containing protein n=1 Tax=Streptomyces sp. NPDC059906 TaxID=3346997 RepID=UPI00366051A8